MHGEDPHGEDDNRFYLPLDLLLHVEDLIRSGVMAPSRMVIVGISDSGSMEVYSSNLNTMETLGILNVAQHSIIDGSATNRDLEL